MHVFADISAVDVPKDDDDVSVVVVVVIVAVLRRGVYQDLYKQLGAQLARGEPFGQSQYPFGSLLFVRLLKPTNPNRMHANGRPRTPKRR